MTFTQAAELVTKEGCHLVRSRKNEPGQYDAKPFADGGNKRGWVYLDAMTAGAIMAVKNALSVAISAGSMSESAIENLVAEEVSA